MNNEDCFRLGNSVHLRSLLCFCNLSLTFSWLYSSGALVHSLLQCVKYIPIMNIHNLTPCRMHSQSNTMQNPFTIVITVYCPTIFISLYLSFSSLIALLTSSDKLRKFSLCPLLLPGFSPWPPLHLVSGIQLPTHCCWLYPTTVIMVQITKKIRA